MTTMVTEIYDALISAGAPDDKARKAAEVLANYDDRFVRLERKIDGVQIDLERKIDGVRTDLERKIDGVQTGLENRIVAVEGRVNLLAWMVGTNITLTLLVLGKLFLLPGR